MDFLHSNKTIGFNCEFGGVTRTQKPTTILAKMTKKTRKRSKFKAKVVGYLASSFAIIVYLLSIQIPLIYSEPTIEVTKFQVPTRALTGKMNRLICQYQLKGLSLHAMKLFKDNNEFYRYLPPNRQLDKPETKLVFEVPGIRVDERRSNGTQVSIGPLTKQSSGLYKCQVSIEDTFKSVSAERRMQVVTASEMNQQTTSLATPNLNGKKQLTPATNAFQQQQQQSGSIPPSSFFNQEPKSLVQSRQQSRQTTTTANNNNNNNHPNHHSPSELASSTANSALKNTTLLLFKTLISSLVSSLVLIIVNK